jgi:hypothetical protein
VTIRHRFVVVLAVLGACAAPEAESLPAARAQPPGAVTSPWEPPIGNVAGKAYVRAAQPYNLPPWAHARVAREGHTRTLAPALHLNPFYQSGDFDGDGRLDVAVMVARRGTGEVGVLMVHGGAAPTVLIGAGTPMGNGGTDFRWMTNWTVQPATESGTSGVALELIKLESGRGVISWDGRAYQWRQADD